MRAVQRLRPRWMRGHLLDNTLQTFTVIGPTGRGIKPWLFPRLRDGEGGALKSEARMDDSMGAAQMVAVLVIPVPCIMHLLPSLLGWLMPRWLARLAKLTAMYNPEVKSGHTPGGVRVTAHHSQRHERHSLSLGKAFQDDDTVVFCT